MSPPTGSVSTPPLLQPRLFGAETRSLLRIFPTQSEEPDQDKILSGERVSTLKTLTDPFGPFHWMSESPEDESQQTIISHPLTSELLCIALNTCSWDFTAWKLPHDKWSVYHLKIRLFSYILVYRAFISEDVSGLTSALIKAGTVVCFGGTGGI